MSREDMVAEAEAILGWLGGVRRALLAAAIEAARLGDLAELEATLPTARQRAMEARAEAERGQAARERVARAVAEGRTGWDLYREYLALQIDQRRNHHAEAAAKTARPDDRTGRRARRLMRLDGVAMRMMVLDEAHLLITGRRLVDLDLLEQETPGGRLFRLDSGIVLMRRRNGGTLDLSVLKDGALVPVGGTWRMAARAAWTARKMLYDMTMADSAAQAEKTEVST